MPHRVVRMLRSFGNAALHLLRRIAGSPLVHTTADAQPTSNGRATSQETTRQVVHTPARTGARNDGGIGATTGSRSSFHRILVRRFMFRRAAFAMLLAGGAGTVYGQGYSTWSGISGSPDSDDVVNFTAGRMTGTLRITERQNLNASAGFFVQGGPTPGFPGGNFSPVDPAGLVNFINVNMSWAQADNWMRYRLIFDHPVTDPVLAFYNMDGGRYQLGGTITRLSGNGTFEVSAPYINNTTNVAQGGGCTITPGEGCGSVRLSGTYNASTPINSFYQVGISSGDSNGLAIYVPGDYGDAPASYGSVSHVVGSGMRLGSSITADAGDFNSAAASGDTDDALPFLSFVGNVATYTVSNIPMNGVLAGAQLCGWIDFNRNGTFDSNERACSPTLAAGTTSTSLTWTVPTGNAFVAGVSYARLRLTTDTAQLASPNNQAWDGEVEDYRINLFPRITLTKALVPATDAGRFNLSVSPAFVAGTGTATNVGDGGTTGVAVANLGTSVTISETAGTSPPTTLADYASTMVCIGRAGGQIASGTTSATFTTIPAANSSVSTPAAAGDSNATVINCTVTNRAAPTLTVRKTSQGGVGTFDFSGTNGVANHSITTVTSGTAVNGAVQRLTTIGAATNVTEAAATGYSTTANCTGLGSGGTATYNAGTRTIALDAAATAAGSAIVCDFTNTAVVNLAVTKTATPNGTYLPGQSLNYTITVTNNGPAAASGISVTDTVPSNVTVSNWTCSASGAGNDCDTTAAGTDASGSTNTINLPNVSLASGSSLTITVTGTAALSATGNIVNTATATPPTGTTCTTPPCARTSSVTNTDGGAPQLTIVKTATPGAFAAGQPGTYSLQVSNTGSSSTSGTISVSDPLPAGITATLPITATGWDCSTSTTTQVNCSTTSVLLPGNNAPVINVNVAVASGVANPVVNTATVQGGGDSTCPATTARCQSTTTTPTNAPRLDVTKTLAGNLVVGQPSTYTIQVRNGGTGDTLAGTVTDTVPNGLTIGAVSTDCAVSGQVVTCNIAAGMSPGQSISYTVEVTPQASTAGQSVTNTAVANNGGDPTCPAAAHCTGTTTNTVNAPQLLLTKSASPDPFVVNAQGNYTLTLTNNGTAATTAATTISDTLPGGLTIGAMPAGCTLAGQAVTCTVAAGLATNSPVSFVIPVTPQSSLAGLSVTNTATATGGDDTSCAASADPTTLPARCRPSITTNVSAPRLDIVKSASGNSFVVGVPASYTLQVTNSGSAATTGDATVSDVVPADLTINSAPGCTISGQTVTCTIPAPLATGTSTSFTINVTPTAAASGQNLTNTATVQGGGDPTCPADTTHCSSTVDVPVDAPRLVVVKTASAASFMVGQPAGYTITVTNTGVVATTAEAAVVDTVPASLTIGAPLPADCTANGQDVRCTIATGLAPNAPVRFVIPVTPTQAAAGTTVSNTATVGGGGDMLCPLPMPKRASKGGPVDPNCSSTVDVPVGDRVADLQLVKTDNDSMGAPGKPITWTLTTTNAGPDEATDVVVTDPLPPGLTYVSASGNGWTCALDGGAVRCTRASLANGATAVITLTLAVPQNYVGPNPIVNTADVTSAVPDPTPPNNHGSDGTPILRQAVTQVPALHWPALLGMIVMLAGFALVAQVQRRRIGRK
jgi:uncharacterized repeat protein (TIGR01451 family)